MPSQRASAPAGRVSFEDLDITALPTHRIIAPRIACVLEGRRGFPAMTVVDNPRAGAYRQKDRARIGQRFEQVWSIFPRLKDRAGQLAGTMSGGEQAMLSRGRLCGEQRYNQGGNPEETAGETHRCA